MKINELISQTNLRHYLKQLDRPGMSDELSIYHGFEPVKDGHGMYGNILIHPRLPYIIKVFDSRDRGYLTFLEIARQHQDNQHFPKIKGKPMKIGPNVYVIRLEKLYPITMREFDKIEYLLHNMVDHADWKDEITPGGEHDEFLRKFPKFVEAIEILKVGREGKKIAFDLHEGNIMKRSDGTLVIIDPFEPINN